jgi:hypothetical protein
MDSWKKLYSLAGRIYALKPWRYMYEDELIGVRDPVSGTLGFISVMGNNDEHYALTVYLGERALGQFLKISDESEDIAPEMVLEIPQLMLSFEERDFLEKEDRAIMKQNGVAVSGKTLFPLFRSYRPGMVPWFLEDKEPESMIQFLEQFLEVAVAPESGNPGSRNDSEEDDVYLVREYKKAGETVQWHDTWQEITIPEDPEIQAVIDVALLEKVKTIPKGKNIYAVDFFLTPGQVREKNKRPFFPYMLLIVDDRSEMVLHSDLLEPAKGIDQMLCKIPGQILTAFAKGKTLPQTVCTGSHRLTDILAPLMKSLGIKLKYTPKMDSLELAKSAIFDFFTRD